MNATGIDTSTCTTRRPRRSRGLIAGVAAVAGLAVIGATAPVVAGTLVHTDDLAKHAVTSDKIARNAVKGKALAAGAVKNRKIRDGAVTYAKLSADLQPLWAVVWGGPTINKGKGAVAGAYEGVNSQVRVTFDRDVSKCSYTATMSQPDSQDVEQNGFINVSSFTGDPKAVLVRTRDTAGAPAPRGFTVQVWC
jgi:hypothetical protein